MTNKMLFPQLRDQATALRLAGKSLREIKEITGVTSNSRLAEAVRGVPPPAWTRRPRAKDDAHVKARELRARGYTYVEIAAELGVSKSSVSLWVRDMPRLGPIRRAKFQGHSVSGTEGVQAAEFHRRDAKLQAITELREQATALRLAGRSLREIKEITGVTSNSRLSEALRGVPPPTWTKRPQAKDDLRAAARALRTCGYTYPEITAELGVSKSSVSLWVRDIPRVGRISYEEVSKRRAVSRSTYWASESPRRESRRQAIADAAAAQIGRMSERELLIAGAVAYWCEGTKNKPYRRSDRVIFINSDPGLILLFLRFLAVAGIQRERLSCRVAIHESADVGAAYQFWQDVTGLPEDQFQGPTLKRHNPKTIRKNTGQDYHGCLVIYVRKGLELYRQIEGWATAAMGEVSQHTDQTAAG